MMFLIFLLLVNVIFDTTTARSLLSRRKPLWVGPVDIDQEISPAQLGKPYLGQIHDTSIYLIYPDAQLGKAKGPSPIKPSRSSCRSRDRHSAA